MLLRRWDSLPQNMQTPEVRPYYDILQRKKSSLLCKRLFDIIMSLLLLVVLSPAMLIVALLIAVDSRGSIFYRQTRVTAYGKEFRIHKFRTMVNHADQIGTQVTVGDDSRITRMGKFLRGCRLDELPQLIDVLMGDMSFVGTRPEVPKYVAQYTPAMQATLLLPAGITSEASIRYKDESQLLDAAKDVDKTYMDEVLPGKMRYNLKSIAEFTLRGEIGTMLRTVGAVLGKTYEDTAVTAVKKNFD